MPDETTTNYGMTAKDSTVNVSGTGNVYGGKDVTVTNVQPGGQQHSGIGDNVDTGGGMYVAGDVHFNQQHERPAYQFTVLYADSPIYGREDELARVAEMLAGDRAVVAVTTGIGGVGKSYLAAHVGHRYRPRFPGGVYTLRMEQPDGISAQVAGYGGAWLANWHPTDVQKQAAAVRADWDSRPERFLLIMDNCEDPQLLADWQPKTSYCRVLITARRSEGWSGRVKQVALGTLEGDPKDTAAQATKQDAARRLLLTPRANRAASVGQPSAAGLDALMADPAAIRICESVGYLPLALAIAGATFADKPRVYPTLEAYERALLTAKVDVLTDMPDSLVADLPDQQKRGIAATFALSYDALGAGDAVARTMLHRAALCAPAPLPFDLLLRLGGLNPADADAVAQGDAARARLCAVGLLTDTAGVLTLHRLVAAYVRGEREREGDTKGGQERRRPEEGDGADVGETDTDLDAVVEALAREVKLVNDAGYPKAGEVYLPHLQWLADDGRLPDIELTATLLNNYGYLLDMAGDYARALPLYERALAIHESVLGANHPLVASSLNNLAELHRAQGDYARALPLSVRALAIRETVLGANHPATATSLNNLAELHRAQGDYARALPLSVRALAIRESVLGANHPLVASSLNNLAGLYQAQGDYAAALPLYERALEIRESVLGAEHPDTATSLNNLAGLYKAQGDYARALPLYARALEIRETVLGTNHPDTATSLNNLALLYQAQGDPTRALPLYERALVIAEKNLGETHPQTAGSLNNLAELHRAQGDYARALPLYVRALAIHESVLGANHPATATSLNNLAGLFYNTGDLAKAHEYMLRAVGIMERALGAQHPSTRTVRKNLRAIEAKMDDGKKHRAHDVGGGGATGAGGAGGAGGTVA